MFAPMNCNRRFKDTPLGLDVYCVILTGFINFYYCLSGNFIDTKNRCGYLEYLSLSLCIVYLYRFILITVRTIIYITSRSFNALMRWYIKFNHICMMNGWVIIWLLLSPLLTVFFNVNKNIRQIVVFYKLKQAYI